MKRLIAILSITLLTGCSTHVTLIGRDGSRVEYKGAKVFTNTSVALSSGPGCKIPADPNVPALTPAASDSPAAQCDTQVATIAGVNISGLTSTILGAAVAAIAMAATAS